MSRSKNEHHKISRNEKVPSPYVDNEGKHDRHRKMKPYGNQGYCGWGGLTYIKKWGDIILDVIKKDKARKDAKKEIREQLEEIEDNKNNILE